MADTGNHRKRRRLHSYNKLSKGHNVEVRSVEDGFQGSWHSGLVIACGDGYREVKYDNLLQDDEDDLLIETVEVSSSTDRILTTPKTRDRGRIRPLPSSRKLAKENLRYGLCVDCDYNDAWWEGVVFDHDEGSSKRRIFFPDIGDEMRFNFEDLRLTLDWDEITGTWNPRGNWLFLEIFEEYERDTFIPVSLKQIWYDMRERNEFGEIGEWPFPVESLWRKLVGKIIDDSLKLTADAFVKECLSSGVLSDNCKNEGSLTMVGEMCKHAELETDLQDCAPTNNQVVPVQPKALSIICSDQKGSDSNTRPDVEKNLLCRSKRKLQPDHSELNLQPQFRPQSIYEYVQTDRPAQPLTKSLRRHLCSVGYKMEQCDKLNCVRYTSPLGRRFYNLRQCVNFEKQVAENSSLAAEDFQHKKISSSRLALKSPYLHVEPKYCPEAVAKYVRSSKNKQHSKKSRSELQDDARRHLSAIGWSFWPKVKRGVEEWRYESPTTKKIYYSLKSACRAEVIEGMKGRTPSPVGDAYSEGKGLLGGELSVSNQEFCEFSSSNKRSRKLPRSLRKYSTGGTKNLQRRKQNGAVHSMPSLPKSKGQEQEAEVDGFTMRRSIKRLSNSFLSKKKKALGKVKNSSDSSNLSRVLRSSKRACQAGPSSSSQAPRTVLSWLIDNAAVLPREKVCYYRQGDDQPAAEGRITGYGINCTCCKRVFTLNGFEAHAGSYSHRPATNIFFRDGKSLAQRQLEMMHQKVRNFSREPLEKIRGKRHKSWNDHICSICHYGGELILCDRCPSSFHARCLGLQDIPEGDWFCPSCCCGICGESHFDLSTEYSTDRSVLSCHQCEQQYHARCIRERELVKVNVHPTEDWFCCKMCEKVHWGLQQLLGKPILVGHNNLTWTLIKPMDYLASDDGNCDSVAMAENYSKLSIALEVIHECFEPVKEPRTRRDLVEDVIFCRGSHLNRLNFRGFYTVLLERNDELITVAILRVYGDKVAEIPLIGTRFKHRRLGMCRIVMQEIEKNLIELGVNRLVLPAAASVLNTWTTAFGFTPVTKCERSEFISYSFLDFQDTVMCQKLLRKLPSPPLQHLSRDMSVAHYQVHRNMERNSIIADTEGNSSISEVSQEYQVEESETVDQRGLMNGTEEKLNGSVNGQDTPIAMVTDSPNGECEPCNSLEFNQRKIERDKCDGNFKFYTRKKAVELRHPVPQANCPKVEVSCR